MIHRTSARVYEKQEAIFFWVQGWPQGEGIHKMRGLG